MVRFSFLFDVEIHWSGSFVCVFIESCNTPERAREGEREIEKERYREKRREKQEKNTPLKLCIAHKNIQNCTNAILRDAQFNMVPIHTFNVCIIAVLITVY